MRQTNRKLYPVASGLAAAMLLCALASLPYGYYTLLRWAVCAVAVYGVIVFAVPRKIVFVMPLGVVALLFNPLMPVHLSRSTWAPIDIIASVMIGVSGLTAYAAGRKDIAAK